jgi:hypothetical protein
MKSVNDFMELTACCMMIVAGIMQMAIADTYHQLPNFFNGLGILALGIYLLAIYLNNEPN